MLRRSTKVQLILFVVITLLGISYVSAEYVGLAKYVTGNKGCTISADFPDSGGIFSNAEVTYRGVTVGKVGALHLIPRGTRVDLKLDSCSSPHIPANVSATVANRSVVGEQYVDLEPPAGTKSDAGPYLSSHSSPIPMSRNHIPTATQTLLVDLDRLFNSVPLDALRTTIGELGKSMAGRGADLGRLLDATDAFINAASRTDNLDATIQLIDESSSVLQTQLDQQEPLKIWTHNLNLLSQQFKASDGDFRHLLRTGPSDVATVADFVRNNRTDLGVTLANLSTVHRAERKERPRLGARPGRGPDQPVRRRLRLPAHRHQEHAARRFLAAHHGDARGRVLDRTRDGRASLIHTQPA
jgi:phospholipid/cholesterol/gamma-HCH transport system substrate-binding protein